MKLQTLTVLFIIVMLPIILTVSEYIESEKATIYKQSSYDTMLTNATFDAMEAYQINESSSTTSDITTEKMRDINASVKTFYNSLAISMGTQGYDEEELQGFVPCLVYGLYDGYYIYSRYEDKGEGGNSSEMKYGLKPYIYYTENITKGTDKLTISYTLDNYIIVTGVYNGKNIAYSGYLICDANKKYIEQNEELKENVYSSNNGIPGKNDAKYKYYKSNQNNGTETDKNGQSIKYYNIDDKWYSYGTDGNLKQVIDVRIKEGLNNEDGKDTSASKYFEVNQKFSKWVSDKLSQFKNEDGKQCNYLKIDNNNNPDIYSSDFNEHRREVIKKSIEKSLKKALYNFRKNGDKQIEEFEMPEINETDWDMIINNVCMISFMQGLPLKYRMYSGYSVVLNTQSKEFVDPDEIYLITEDNLYHKITWKGFEDEKTILGAYRNIDFKTRKQCTTEIDIINYYYPHENSGDYESIVTSRNVEEATFEKGKEKNAIEVVTEKAEKNGNLFIAIKKYYTALYRERYINYKSLNFGYDKE